jgi:hypothetical protein
MYSFCYVADLEAELTGEAGEAMCVGSFAGYLYAFANYHKRLFYTV